MHMHLVMLFWYECKDIARGIGVEVRSQDADVQIVVMPRAALPMLFERTNGWSVTKWAMHACGAGTSFCARAAHTNIPQAGQNVYEDLSQYTRCKHNMHA